MLRRPNDTYYRRAVLIAALCLLLGSMATADNAYAQARQTTYPVANGVNEDPDQGEPQANPPTPPPPRPRLQPPRPPQPLFPDLRPPWATQLEDLRRRLYDEYGLTFGAAYNQLYQHTSATAPTALYDQALGAWAQASMTWTPLDRGGDHEGTLVVRGAFRGSLGDNAVPAQFGVRDIGSIWSNYEFTSSEIGFPDRGPILGAAAGTRVQLPHRQPGTPECLQLLPIQGCEDGVHFQPVGVQRDDTLPDLRVRWVIPMATGGQRSGSLCRRDSKRHERRPRRTSAWTGTLSGCVSISTASKWKNWRRDNGEFDHFHIDVFYASERSTRSRYVAEHGRRRLQGGRREAGRPRRGLRQLHLQHCGGRRDRGDLVRANGGRRAGVPPAFRCAGRGCRRLHVVPIDPWPAADGRTEEPVGVEIIGTSVSRPTARFAGVQFIFNPVIHPMSMSRWFQT